MKYLACLLIAPIIVLLLSCNHSTPSADGASAAPSVTYKEGQGTPGKSVANLFISGMTCSAGCGGKIQKELRALQGVMGTALDFSEERTDNVVSVEFDPSAVNEQQMIQCVNAIADGQYHVNSVEIVTAKKNDNPSTSDGVGVEMYDFGKVFQVLNLLQSVSRLVE